MPVHLFTSDKGDLLSNELPNDTAVEAGGGGVSSVVKASGDLFMQTPSGGSTPGGTAADYVVALATIPAGSFDIANRCITITANGNFAANGNTKTVKVIVNPTSAVVGSAISGGTTIATTGAVTTNGSAFALGADIIKTGAAGSNTQTAIHQAAQVGSAVAALSQCQSLTLTESAAITVAITINCATTATDASLWNFQGQWFN